jgi:L-rhamnonate dehydratase
MTAVQRIAAPRTGVCSPIERVETLVLRADADAGDLDSAQETVVVRLTDAEGRVGIGEADSVEEAVHTLVHRRGGHGWSRGLESVLLGRDPVQIGSLWADLAEATAWSGPGGIAMHAVAAVDVALHDLAGKQLGRPAYHLLGGARRDRLSPYATCWVSSSGDPSLTELLDRTLQLMSDAVSRGFRAVKMELIFGSAASDRDLVDCIAEGRRTVGEDVELLVDFGYRWSDWRDALAVLRAAEPHRVYLAEAALRADDLLGHARLARAVDTRIGGAEMASTLAECRSWLEIGQVDVLQPDVARAGGLTNMRRIAELAELHGALVIPHCWRTGINAAASRHLHAALPNVPMVEFLTPSFSSSPLREGLVTPEPELSNGFFDLPTAPGLGIELVDELVDRYLVPC